MSKGMDVLESAGGGTRDSEADDRGKSKLDVYKEVPAGTHIVEAVYQDRNFELNPVNVNELFNLTVGSAAEFIRGHEEGVTLIIPMMGGIPLAESLIRKLGENGYDLTKLDLRFEKKYMEDGEMVPVLDDEETPFKEVRVMIDDIADRVGEYSGVAGILKRKSGDDSLVCFTPLAKDNRNGRKSTEELAKQNGYKIAPLTPGQTEYAHINYAAIAPNEWIDCAFGMNSGASDFLARPFVDGNLAGIERFVFEDAEGAKSMTPVEYLTMLARNQALERCAPVCLAGNAEALSQPDKYPAYIQYLREVSEIYLDGNSAAYELLFKIEQVHFLSGLKGKAEALHKMGIAREYFEGLKSVNHLFVSMSKDFRKINS